MKTPRRLLLPAVISSLLVGGPIQAQEAEEPIEEIIITGSRIRQDPLEARTPVQFVTEQDIDRSGAVGFDDLLAVLTAWGPHEPCPPAIAEDLDHDCEVGFADLLVVLATWGACP